LLSIATGRAAEARAECVDSSLVNGFKVRSVSVNSLFGRVPKNLRRQLERHRGEPYSADRAVVYLNEIKLFLNSDPVQQKYEKLIANKLKLSVKGTYLELECVEPVEAAECLESFAGDSAAGPVTECVDVRIKHYSVEIDALNSSPYLLLFPRSAAAALYGAIPRPLLALNPAFDAAQDREFGPSVSADTSTDLLDLPRLLNRGPTPGSNQPPAPSRAGAADATTGDLTLTVTEEPRASRRGEPSVASGAEESDVRLLLSAKGRKSLSEAFYDTRTRLALSRTEALARFQKLALEVEFAAHNLPHGGGDFLRNAVALGFSTDLRLKRSPFKLISLGGRYRWSRNRFYGGGAMPSELGSENGFEARTVADGNIKKGLARVALWLDGGSQAGGRGDYRRLSAEAGYGREFVVPRKKRFHKIRVDGRECFTPYAEDPTKNEPTVGVEVIVGAGRAWGEVPEYARFYGGNSPVNFLYDELSSQSLTAAPSGPLLRSVRQQQAGAATSGAARVGGTSFRHANFNVSLPVAGWSRPLIPPEWVAVLPREADESEYEGRVAVGEPVCRDLKYMVKNAVRVSGANLLTAQRARELLSERQRRGLRLAGRTDLTPAQQTELREAQEALSAARARVGPEVSALFEREILPITDFIADQANIFSVKPLLMFDVAHLSSGDGRGRTRYGVGGGLQIDAVLARFEFGYLLGLNRAPGDERGNLVGRLVFKRFF
jgi:hypothetical protein